MATQQERQRLAAQRYLAANRIEPFLRELTTNLLLDVPGEPIAYMLTRVEEKIASCTGSQIGDAASNDGAHQSAAAASTDSAVSRIPASWKTPQELQEALGAPLPRLVGVFGGPTSGKTTLASHLADAPGVALVSMSDLVHQEVRAKTELGDHLYQLLLANRTIPTELLTRLIVGRIEQATSSRDRLADGGRASQSADGSNRTEVSGDSHKTWCLILDDYPQTIEQFLSLEEAVGCMSYALFLECSQEEMLERLQAKHNIAGRVTDRLRFYYRKTVPLKHLLLAQQKAELINASETTREECFRQVKALLER